MILAIDPGNIESGYVFTKDNLEVLEKGKIKNEDLLKKLEWFKFYDSVNKTHIAIEMIASYGMPVGVEVFETCVWIGRFLEACKTVFPDAEIKFIYRKDEKKSKRKCIY